MCSSSISKNNYAQYYCAIRVERSQRIRSICSIKQVYFKCRAHVLTVRDKREQIYVLQLDQIYIYSVKTQPFLWSQCQQYIHTCQRYTLQSNASASSSMWRKRFPFKYTLITSTSSIYSIYTILSYIYHRDTQCIHQCNYCIIYDHRCRRYPSII